MAFTIDVDRLRARAERSGSAIPASPLEQKTTTSTDPYAGLQAYYETLLAHGLTESAAFDIAEAVCLEREQGGERHVCALECKNHRRGCCMKPRAAGVPAQLGELAFIPQRCAAYELKR